MLEGLTPPAANRGSCKVAIVSEALSEADKAILNQAIDNRTEWPIKTLARALNERGLSISESPLTNHRAKSCACYR
jgi:hypothetical protein